MPHQAPRCAEGPKQVSFKVGPPKRIAEATMGFTRLNTNTLDSIQTSEEDHQLNEERKARKRLGTTKTGLLMPLAFRDDDFEAPYSVKLQLQIWQDALKQELTFYRSVVVASEVLLHRVAEVTATHRQPNMLKTASALTVLNYFLPMLGVYEELTRGVMEELNHAIYISPAKSFSLETSATAYARKTFFDSFIALTELYYFHRDRAVKFRSMVDHEGRVLDRAVLHWQRTFALKMLQTWRGYTQHANNLRRKYQKVFRRATTGIVVVRAIKNWKRRAHVVHLERLANMNSKANEQLRAAHSLERQTQERHKLTQEEARRKERLLADSTVSREKVLVAHTELTAQLEETTTRYLEIRKVWTSVVLELFGDVHKVPGKDEWDSWVEFMVPALQGMLVEGKQLKLTAGLLRQLIKHFWSPAKAREGGEEAPSSSSNVNVLSSMKTDDAEAAILMFSAATGTNSPIQTQDIIRGDVLKVRYFLLLLMELYNGGHVSMFFPNHLPTEISLRKEQLTGGNLLTVAPAGVDPQSFITESSAEHTPRFQSEVVTEDTLRMTMRLRKKRSFSPIASTSPVADMSDAAKMTRDWDEGMGLMKRNECLSNRPVGVLAELSQFGETMKLERDAQRLFDFASSLTSDGTIPRSLLEDALPKFITGEELSVASYAYPPQGIITITDFVHYVTSLAALIAQSPKEVIHLLETHVSISEGMSFVIATREEQVQLVIESFFTELTRAFKRYAKHPTEAEQLAIGPTMDVDGVMQFLADYRVTSVDTTAAVLVVDGMAEVVPHLNFEGFFVLVSSFAVLVYPSPFTPLSLKVKLFLNEVFHRG